MKHIDWMAKIMLTTGLIVAYGYALEAFFSWYGGDKYEMYMFKNRVTGPYTAGRTTDPVADERGIHPAVDVGQKVPAPT